MANFLLIYHGGETMENATPEQQQATMQQWMNWFARAGAVVLERGGPLSHAAILARELGLPAVTNVGGATSRLDGREVMVDGDSGIVVVTGEEP